MQREDDRVKSIANVPHLCRSFDHYANNEKQLPPAQHYSDSPSVLMAVRLYEYSNVMDKYSSI